MESESKIVSQSHSFLRRQAILVLDIAIDPHPSQEDPSSGSHLDFSERKIQVGHEREWVRASARECECERVETQGFRFLWVYSWVRREVSAAIACKRVRRSVQF
eukprot:scaffold5730_cov55-Cyclotella_meneghiniana.AAC.11